MRYYRLFLTIAMIHVTACAFAQNAQLDQDKTVITEVLVLNDEYNVTGAYLSSEGNAFSSRTASSGTAAFCQRASGAMNVEPKLSPADTRATASVRFSVNHRVVTAVIGAYRLPAARPTSTPKAPFSATTQQVESTVIHPDLACNWAGIGGTVVDSNNSPVIGTVVVLRGTLNGDTVEQQTVTGINKEYGPSGFEFVRRRQVSAVISASVLKESLTSASGTTVMSGDQRAKHSREFHAWLREKCPVMGQQERKAAPTPCFSGRRVGWLAILYDPLRPR